VQKTLAVRNIMDRTHYQFTIATPTFNFENSTLTNINH